MVVDWWERARAEASGEEKGEARRSGGGGRAADSIGRGAQGESTVQSRCAEYLRSATGLDREYFYKTP
jgi:hypothetical protein